MVSPLSLLYIKEQYCAECTPIETPRPAELSFTDTTDRISASQRHSTPCHSERSEESRPLPMEIRSKGRPPSPLPNNRAMAAFSPQSDSRATTRARIPNPLRQECGPDPGDRNLALEGGFHGGNIFKTASTIFRYTESLINSLQTRYLRPYLNWIERWSRDSNQHNPLFSSAFILCRQSHQN